MRAVLVLIATIVFAVHAQAQVHTITVGGYVREYYLHLPSSLPPDAPLVLVLHGYTGSATNIRGYSGMDLVADAGGFAVCYPQGIVDQWGNRFWNVGYDFHQGQTVDDVLFLTTLVQHLETTHGLSSRHTFATGMSNGGEMSYMLACQASGVFEAIASVSGMMMQWIYNSCTPTRPIPVLEIHGTADGINLWDGDPLNTLGWGAFMGTRSIIDYWALQNGCVQTSHGTLPDIVNEGSFIRTEKHLHGLNNNEVWLYEVVNGDHDWPGAWGNMDINSSDEIWSFFSRVIAQNPSFCGGGLPCPCNNAALPESDEGCLNSTAHGATLELSGLPSVSSDSLVLRVKQAPPETIGIFVQNLSSALPMPFYDGVLCLPSDSHLLRHYSPPGVQPTLTDATGTGVNAQPMTASDHLGDTQPGVTVYYQFWYRDSPGYGATCTTGANFSSGVSVVWE